MKTYIILYASGKVEVLTNENPQAALDYLADNHEYIDTIYQGDLVSFPQAKEQEEEKKPSIKEEGAFLPPFMGVNIYTRMMRKPYQKEQSLVFVVEDNSVLHNPYFDTKKEAINYIKNIKEQEEGE